MDTHAHGVDMLPRPAALLRRAITRGLPADLDLDALTPSGPDVVVACAVGDDLVTRLWWPRNRWASVRRQLDDLAAAVTRTDGVAPIRTRDDLDRTAEAEHRGILLGLEGGDVVADDPARLDDLAALGVRVLGVVHFSDNALGTMGMRWNGTEPRRARPPGLTRLGREVVHRAAELGVVIDVAHADIATTLDVCGVSTTPVLCSHTGARALADFPRFVTDEQARAIAGTGGLVGLWPFRDARRGNGISTMAEFTRHAEHLAGLIGPDHLCLGTDQNGVPGFADGYSGWRDWPVLLAALRHAGLDADQVDAVTGGNAVRLFGEVLPGRRVSR